MTGGYYLISKTPKIPYCKYRGDALRLINQTARTFEEVIVGSKKNPQIKRKITTFYNSDGDIIERVFDFSDKPYKNRLYVKRENVIGQDEFVTSTHVKEYTLPRELKKAHTDSIAIGYARTLFWTPVKFFTNHLSENIDTGEKVLTQVRQTNLMKPQKEIHTFIEFPHILSGKIADNAEKILKFTVNTLTGHKVNPKNAVEKGAILPQNDSFLGMRALDINDSKSAFSQKFISERGLKNKRIKINPEYLPTDDKEELAKALFDPNEGSINFVKGYKFTSKSEVCDTSRHETEHGWQFYLHARNTKGGTTPWEEKMYDLFEDLPKSLKREAQKYTDSINSYVTIAENRKLYLKNYIEKLANEQGEKARVLYDYERKKKKKEFPHIPKELL